MLTLLPAIDVIDGKAVMLRKGVSGSESVYGNPLEVAQQFEDEGAHWLHLVDLDAAFRRGENREMIARLIERTPLQVEVSGGIKDEESLQRALDMGAARVIIGTAALEEPEWTYSAIQRFGEKVAIGLDARGDTLAARGWTRDGGDLWEALENLNAAGAARYIVTDVNRDGMLNGPNLQLLQQVCGATASPVIASGGVSNLEDIREIASLVPLGVEGALVGKALYEAAFTLPEALQAAAGK